MSLSALNSPILVSSLGMGLFSVIPTLEQAVINDAVPLSLLKIGNVVVFGLNVFATSRPGRIDGAAAQEFNDKGERRNYINTKDKSTDVVDKEQEKAMEKLTTGRGGRTLLAPAGWAFAIWGPIFLGEFAFVSTHLLLDESSPVASVVKRVSIPFMASQLFQVLWTTAFRPKYKGRLMFISASMLSGIAYSLSKAHGVFVATSQRQLYNTSHYILYFLPMSLHFGWTTAASLVNWNGAFGDQDSVSAKRMAWIGHASAVAATAIGVIVTLKRSAPVFGGVISWALAAVASGMKMRVNETKNDKQDSVGVYGAKTQRRLCQVCAGVSAAASIYATIAQILS